MKIGKKAQTEDMFADFIIGLILTIAAVAVIAMANANDSNNISLVQSKDTAQLYGIDALTLLKTPVQRAYLAGSNWDRADATGVTFGDMFAIIADGDKENYPWVFSENGNGIVAKNDIKCTPEFEKAFNTNLPFGWQIELFDKTGKRVFWCSPMGIKFVATREEKYNRVCQIMKTNIPTLNGNNAAVQIGVCP